MTQAEIRERLFQLRDEGYAAMQVRIIPTVKAERIIGVRTPELRTLAWELYQDETRDAFLADLPHPYFEEDQLHAFVISEEKAFGQSIRMVEAFLPYIDNWATCDQLSPKAFRKHPEKLLPYIRKWIRSRETYTVRFAIGMLMRYYLEDRFSLEYPDLVASVRSEEYYIRMMAAWYFATALAKQYEAVLPYLEKRKLEAWTHNKAIEKSLESFRIKPEQKAYLKTLKMKKADESTQIYWKPGRMFVPEHRSFA